jgi:hypothetical protein
MLLEKCSSVSTHWSKSETAAWRISSSAVQSRRSTKSAATRLTIPRCLIKVFLNQPNEITGKPPRISADSLSAVYRGPKKNVNIKEINGS